MAIQKNPLAAVRGRPRWPNEMIMATWVMSETGKAPERGLEYRIGRAGGGFDLLDFDFPPSKRRFDPESLTGIDTTLPLNRRGTGAKIEIPIPWYGGGMSFGSVSLQIMLARAMAATAWNTFTSTGEGGYPEELVPYKDHVITQVATGMFGVREETVQRARLVEIKYAQGAKPGLGGHLLGDKNTPVVAKMRETVAGTTLCAPLPHPSVPSLVTHRNHRDPLRAVNARPLGAAELSSPSDVDMVAVGCYYAGVNIVHLDGGYGGGGAAPGLSRKKNSVAI